MFIKVRYNNRYVNMQLDKYTNDDQTIQKAEQLFDQAQTEELHRKHGNEKTQEACLKIAARQEQTLLNNADQLANFPGHAMQQQVRKIAKTIGTYPPHYKAGVHLKQFRDNNEISEAVFQKAQEILEDVEDTQELIGKKPSAQAGAAVYAAGIIVDDHVTKDEAIELSGVSEPTLRKSYKIMVEELDLVDEILNNHPYPERTMWSE